MIQPQLIESAPRIGAPRIGNPRSARTAAKTRIVRNSRARYTSIARICVVLGVVLVSLLGYVMLTSNVTSLTYSVAKAHHEREALQEETARLDDQIASLRSDDRLARVAARLGMHDSQTFALVRLGTPDTANRGPAWSSIAGWFAPGAPRAR